MGLCDDDFLKAYQIRQLETKLLSLFSKGKISGTIHTCMGQEFTGISICKSLRQRDIVVSNHRCHGHYLARFEDVEGLIGEILGRPSGLCRGFGGSQHLYREGFFSSGIQGGMMPAAAGMAWAKKIEGNHGVVVAFIGDGTLGQGTVYESLNIASKMSLPLLVVVENNGYSQSTAQFETLSGSIEGRAKAFDISYFKSSTDTPAHCIETAEKALSYAREGAPVLFEIETFRLAAHSKGDDFRDEEELKAAWDRDPLTVFLKENRSRLESQFESIDQKIDALIEKALSEKSPINFDEKLDQEISYQLNVSSPKSGLIVKALNEELLKRMEADLSAVIFAEDVRDPYGGTFKATRGLSDRFSNRVINAPISEPSIVGVSLGLALSGHLAMTEIMFGDFVALAFDQILNQAAKMGEMFGTSLNVPLLIRTPMGGGRGYGATHSQSLEKFLAAIPGIDVFLMHPRVNVSAFFEQTVSSLKRPAILVEHKLLYAHSLEKELPSGCELFDVERAGKTVGSVLKTSETPDVTMVCFGGVGLKAEAAMERLAEEEIYCDLYYPFSLNEFPVEAVIESLTRTGRLLTVEEGTLSCGLGSEIVSKLLEKCEDPFLLKRVGALDRPLAASPEIENQILPSESKIFQAAVALFEKEVTV